jgi:hypothetical protein
MVQGEYKAGHSPPPSTTEMPLCSCSDIHVPTGIHTAMQQRGSINARMAAYATLSLSIVLGTNSGRTPLQSLPQAGFTNENPIEVLAACRKSYEIHDCRPRFRLGALWAYTLQHISHLSIPRREMQPHNLAPALLHLSPYNKSAGILSAIPHNTLTRSIAFPSWVPPLP